jgi:hypothetical protein
MNAEPVTTPAPESREEVREFWLATALRRFRHETVHWYASRRPRSYRAEYGRLVAAALLAQPLPTGLVTEADLAHLPPLVADYVRNSGAVGRPRVANFRARFHGRIRAGATKPWMTGTGEQVNTFSPQPSRFFFLNATLFGLPIDVLHVFRREAATMRVRVCSIVPIVNAAGPEMDRGETVTMFNDLCLLAPAALIDAPVIWQAIDERRIQGAYTYGHNTVTAELIFNDAHELVDFSSEDRSRGVVPQRWSTPVHDYQTIRSRRIIHFAEARWHAPAPEGEFAYFELHLDDIEYNAADTHHVSPPAADRRQPHVAQDPDHQLGI